MFRTSDAMLITKMDLLPYVPFSIDAVIADARLVRVDLAALSICALDGQGIESWCQWLDAQRQAVLATAGQR
jgi:hydrogenase nickel incorporation protein HypB